jgi:Predicted integral membrane protein
MRFNPDSSFFKVTTTISQFIVLNILYLIICLPIITIGAATTALFDVTMNYADFESGYLIKDFFKSFYLNWKKSTLIFFSFGLPIIALVFSSAFWLSFQSVVSILIFIVASIGIVYLLISFILSCAQLARFENTTKQVIKNALLLTMAHPLRSLGLLAILITVTFLSLSVPGFSFMLLLLGCSFTAYCMSFLINKTLAEHY